MNSKERLFQFVRDNNHGEIINLLTLEPELISTTYEDYYTKPILYIACHDLAREVSPETVQLLIKHEADLYYRHDDMEAIHFAVLGGNPNILHVVLQNFKHDRRNVIANGNTAINLLVRKTKDPASKDTEMCLKHLLHFDVDVNIANKQGHPPILWAAYKKYTNIIETILNFSHPDLDKGKIDGRTARELIEQNGLYGGKLPEPNTNNNENVSEILLSYIRDGNEDEFLQFPNLSEYVDEETNNGTLLQFACKLNSKNIVKHLIEEGATVTKTSESNKMEPISIAALYGFHEIFKILLDSHTHVSSEILITLLKYIDGYNMEDTNHELCLEALLQSDKNLDVNYSSSNDGNTPLHYAARYADGKFALALLNKGASLADEDRFGFLPIEDLDAGTLEEHFNNCVTVKPESKYNKQNTIVTFDYSTLVPSRAPDNLNNLKKEKFNQDIELETHTRLPDDRRHFSAETNVIGKISDSPELRHLLCHPLVTSFLCVKWRRMEWLFYINLFLYIAFCISLILYIFFVYNNTNQYPNGNPPLFTLLIMTYLLIILRELFQIFTNMRIYFRQFDNWLELSIIGTTAVIIFHNDPGETTAKLFSSLTILLTAVAFMLQIGLHPRMSTYVVMFRTVTFNFFKFLLWYSLLIIAFALTFYKLFSDDNEPSTEINSKHNTSTEEEEQNFFENPSLTFIKTVVMLTGEFDASSINFNSVTSQLTFLAFVFMITIVLFNLLNALAVSDTQIIKNNSKIIGYQERIKRIIYMEHMFLSDPFPLLTKITSICCRCITKSSARNNLRVCVAKRVFIFYDFLKNHNLKLYLNQDYKIIENQNTNKGMPSIRLDVNTIKGIKKIFRERKCQDDQFKEKQMIKEIYNYIEQMKNRAAPNNRNMFNECRV